MSENKSYLDIKVTFIHVVILLIAVIMIGIFLFYIGFNAGKNENIINKPFRNLSSSSNRSKVIIPNEKSRSTPEVLNVEEPDINKELGLFERSGEDKKEGKNKKIIKTIKIPGNRRTENHYSIQVGSFKSHLLAKNYSKKFSMMGYYTEISQFQSDKYLWFRVKVGNFKTLKTANKEKKKLENMEKKKFQTVKLY